MSLLTDNDHPGIRSGLIGYPDSGRALSQLAQTLLRPLPNDPLDALAREAIATYTSALNRCEYCTNSHGSAMAALGGPELAQAVIDQAQGRMPTAPSAQYRRLLPLLEVARTTAQMNGGQVASQQAALEAGFTRQEVHTAALIAAAFCMFNRYVEAIAQPHLTDRFGDFAPYQETGERLATAGYVR